MKALVVEDDSPLREAIATTSVRWRLQTPSGEVRIDEVLEAGDVAEGIRLVESDIDLLLVDVRLGDQSGIRVVEASRKRGDQLPILAMSGQATATEAFQLAALGVRGYLGKPFDMRELKESVQSVLGAAPDLEERAAEQVGFKHIHVVQDVVKRAMLKRALVMADGNVSQAARYLGITRTAVQQMLDRFDVPRPWPPKGH
jgi:two-component system, response regulator RegA